MAFDELIFDFSHDGQTGAATRCLESAGCIQASAALSAGRLENIRKAATSYFAANQTTGAYMWMPEEDALNPEFDIVKGLWESPARDVILNRFESRRAIVLLQNSIFRWMEPGRSAGHLKFHQDARVVIEGEHLLTAWVPLAPDVVDHRASGIEFVPNHLHEIVPIPPDARFNLEIPEDWAAAIKAADKAWRPDLTVGDVMLFSGRCPHASEVSETADQHRLSIEIRFVPCNDSVLEIVSDESYPGYFVFDDDFLLGPAHVLNPEAKSEEYRFKIGLLAGTQPPDHVANTVC